MFLPTYVGCESRSTCFRYTEVMSHVSRGGEDLSSVYSKFIKDRAEIEREYAKNLRKLVGKYNDKTETGRKSKETSQAKGFRWDYTN